MPIALKDVISTKGIRTTAGSKILENYVPVFDATVAANCKAAGLPVLGKTNTDEFAMGSSSENSAYGPSRNPWDPSRVPGGSGGGSAAAVAAGLAPWALGSDTGGSVKLPAAFCGNVGLRPTYGTVSRYGVVAFASSLDQVGPVTRNVRDNALLYSIISGRDENDSTTVDVPPVRIPEPGDLKGIRIGLPRQLNEVEGIEPGVKAAVDAAIAHASALGAEIEQCELPLSVEYGLPCYYLIAPAEASSNLARYDGVRYGPRVDGEDFREMVMRTRAAGFGDEPKRRIMIGTYALSSGYYDAYYGTAQKVRTVIKREHEALFERYDLLISPTCATTAFPIGVEDPGSARDVPHRRADDPVEHGRPAEHVAAVRALRGPARRAAADRAAVLGERALPGRRRARGGDRVRAGSGAAQMSSTWEAVIGLEIHVQLKTRTKMFCRCTNGFGGGPNTQTCPVCLAFPGALPVPNKAAIEETIKLGLALGCTIADRAVFHRKNYFYPDLPKAYQISQYDEPLCSGGSLDRAGRRTAIIVVGIVRAHLEEDAAKNVHVAASGRIHGATATLVDFNRGGTPLLEIVTEPELHSADDAKRFLQLLRQTVVELGLSDAELEKGSMRFDVNVSVRPAGSDELRTRCELKNMNSFNFAAKGIEKEIARQIKIYESGGTVEQETLHFDPNNEDSPPLRSKEEAQDYRYFPEPDLVPIHPPAELVERMRAQVRRAAERADQADRRDALVLRRRRARHRRPRPALVGRRRCRRRSEGDGERARERLRCCRDRAGACESGRAREARLGARRDPARDVRRRARRIPGTTGSRPSPISRRKPSATSPSSTRSSTPSSPPIPARRSSTESGKEGLLGFFVGQVMKETGGKADPRVVSDRVREKLRPVA